MTTSARYTCDKCSGTGILPSFRHIEGGVCFKCEGEGTLSYDPTKRRTGVPTNRFPNCFGLWIGVPDRQAMSQVVRKLWRFPKLRDEDGRVQLEFFGRSNRTCYFEQKQIVPKDGWIYFDVYPLWGDDVLKDALAVLTHGEPEYDAQDLNVHAYQFSGFPTAVPRFEIR